MELGHIQVTGLIDSVCRQTLVHWGLIPSPELVLGKIQLQCIHRDVKPYPITHISLTMNGVTHTMMVGLGLQLVYQWSWDMTGRTSQRSWTRKLGETPFS